MRPNTIEVFWSRVGKTDGCWEWTGRKDALGYGRFDWANTSVPAHRVAYEAAIGRVPSGMELDHICRNRGCCRPDHLEAVTHAENMRRSEPARRTHCPQGHPYDAANTRPRSGSGGRVCKECHRIDTGRPEARERARQKAAAWYAANRERAKAARQARQARMRASAQG